MKRKTMLTTLSALTLGAAVVATSVPALAFGPQDGSGRPDRAAMMMQRFDADSDGKITQEELFAPMSERFVAADTDGDGALSGEELANLKPMGGKQGGDHKRFGGQGHGHGDFERGSKAMRGAMDPEKRAERAARMIERMDANGDGLLSAEELAAGPSKAAKQAPEAPQDAQ